MQPEKKTLQDQNLSFLNQATIKTDIIHEAKLSFASLAIQNKEAATTNKIKTVKKLDLSKLTSLVLK